MGFKRRLVLPVLIASLSVGALLVPLWGTLRSPYVRSLAVRAARQAQASSADARLRGAYRLERGLWVYVHLEGAPGRIGFQHGYLLAPEIADAFQAVKLIDTHDTQRDWEFFRQAAREMLWPRIDAEYEQELKGIVEGLRARGVAMDIDDLVALTPSRNCRATTCPGTTRSTRWQALPA